MSRRFSYEADHEEVRPFGLRFPRGVPVEVTDERVAKKLAAKKSPVSLAACKEAINMGLEVDLQSGLYIESLKFGSLATTEDYHEGTKAFLEKREPVFKGR